MTNKDLKILHYKNRIDFLTQRGEMINHGLIQKAKRKLRALEK